MFWSVMERIRYRDGLLYSLFKKIINRRLEKVKSIKSDRKLYKIAKNKEVGWRCAADKISDPVYCEKLYNSPKLSYSLDYGTRMHLITHMRESAEKKELLADEIGWELKNIKDSSEANRGSIQGGYDPTQTEYYKNRIDKAIKLLAYITDADERERLTREAEQMKENLPKPWFTPKS